MKKILVVIGARPQFIKHAPVEIALKKKFEIISLHTGQHYDQNMSEIFFNQLGISDPKYKLSVGSGNHGVQSGKMLMEIEPVVEKEQPDGILVYGDTNSTLAGALVGAKSHIPVVHIEAGLRSYNRKMPEEINRVVTDHISTILIAPTDEAIKNLASEGIKENVFKTGDVMCDMIQIAAKLSGNGKKSDGRFYYATIHRPYNTDNDERLYDLLTAFHHLDLPIKFSLHPRTKKRIEDIGLNTKDFSNIQFLEPVSYFENIANLSNADALITDSGGMQKEAYMLKKRCITIRPETEWVETLENGWNQLLYNHLDKLGEALRKPLGPYIEGIYGNGNASEEITDILSDFFY